MKTTLSFLLLCLINSIVIAQEDTTKVIYWEINRLDSIGGYPVTMMGNPVLIDTEEGQAVEFDGEDDGLLIASNPLAGTNEFTIEVVFNPYPGGLEEQRFVHIEQDNENRALIELRTTVKEGWFLDTFIKSGSSSCTLYAEDYPHESEKWSHACLVYKDDTMTHYVNGEKEMSGVVSFSPVSSGNTSLGVRQNLVSWYKGAIKTLKVTHRALSPDEFISLQEEPEDTVTISPVFIHTYALPATIYPNPVTNLAHIDYVLTASSQVILKVHNMQNEEVAELINEVQPAGNYSQSFSCQDLPTGIYCFTLQVGQQLITEKFVIAGK